MVFCFVFMHPSSSPILPVHPPQEGNSMVSRLLCAMKQRKKEKYWLWKLEDWVARVEEYLYLSEKGGRSFCNSLVVFGAVRLWDTRRFKIWYPHHFFFSFPTGFSLGVLSTWDVAFNYTKQRNLRRGFRWGKAIEMATKFSRVGWTGRLGLYIHCYI